MTVLPQHSRLMTQLLPGEMVVRNGGHDEFLAVKVREQCLGHKRRFTHSRSLDAPRLAFLPVGESTAGGYIMNDLLFVSSLPVSCHGTP